MATNFKQVFLVLGMLCLLACAASAAQPGRWASSELTEPDKRPLLSPIDNAPPWYPVMVEVCRWPTDKEQSRAARISPRYDPGQLISQLLRPGLMESDEIKEAIKCPRWLDMSNLLGQKQEKQDALVWRRRSSQALIHLCDTPVFFCVAIQFDDGRFGVDRAGALAALSVAWREVVKSPFNEALTRGMAEVPSVGGFHGSFGIGPAEYFEGKSSSKRGMAATRPDDVACFVSYCVRRQTVCIMFQKLVAPGNTLRPGESLLQTNEPSKDEKTLVALRQRIAEKDADIGDLTNAFGILAKMPMPKNGRSDPLGSEILDLRWSTLGKLRQQLIATKKTDIQQLRNVSQLVSLILPDERSLWREISLEIAHRAGRMGSEEACSLVVDMAVAEPDDRTAARLISFLSSEATPPSVAVSLVKNLHGANVARPYSLARAVTLLGIPEAAEQYQTALRTLQDTRDLHKTAEILEAMANARAELGRSIRKSQPSLARAAAKRDADVSTSAYHAISLIGSLDAVTFASVNQREVSPAAMGTAADALPADWSAQSFVARSQKQGEQLATRHPQWRTLKAPAADQIMDEGTKLRCDLIEKPVNDEVTLECTRGLLTVVRQAAEADQAFQVLAQARWNTWDSTLRTKAIEVWRVQDRIPSLACLARSLKASEAAEREGAARSISHILRWPAPDPETANVNEWSREVAEALRNMGFQTGPEEGR